MYPSKEQLLENGVKAVTKWCEINQIEAPGYVFYNPSEWRFSVCGYYRENTIHICIKKCAAIGVAGMAWSYPGYTVDRTPYGVVAHELGHHIDCITGAEKGPYYSNYSSLMRLYTKEKQISSYCPNDAEWFAEIFRVFITNPDLLQRLRPQSFKWFINDGFKPVFTDTWLERLAGAPERTVAAAARKLIGS